MHTEIIIFWHCEQRKKIIKHKRLESDDLNILSLPLIAFGIWLIVDGLFSIIKYRGQTFSEHLIRLIRATVGAVIILIALAES